MQIEFRVLGPFEAVLDDQVVPIGSRKQRMLLCALAARRHTALSVDALLELLWGGSAPPTAEVTLRGLVSRLRRTLGPARGRLVPSEGGYLLRASADEVDADRFSQLVRRARQNLTAEFPEQAADRLTSALALWRGTSALVELSETDWGSAQAARLEEERADAVETLAQAELARGRPAVALHLLEQHLADHPLRERAWEHKLLALYRLGRQADALRAYRRIRGILREELGVEPCHGLRRLHARILAQDPALDLAIVAEAGAPKPALPSAITPLVGRDDELSALAQDLRSSRLLTLTGVGGVGKTRLGLELAREQGAHWDIVRLVELAALDRDSSVGSEMARLLNIPGIRPSEPIALLADRVATRRVLLVLDNCEHVLLQIAEIVGTLLGACPTLTVLATSREPLSVTGETVRPILPLPLPRSDASTPTELNESAAVLLFCQRARATQPAFGLTTDNAEAVGNICRQLDGIPLALELAAARLRVLSTQQVAARLDDRFTLLTAGPRTARPRQQTLRATMDWSYSLLSESEQAGLQALTVFPADFGAAAAAAVVGPVHGDASGEDLVFRLIDKSLVVVRRRAGEARYELLETVRVYGAELLDRSGRRMETLRRHREHYRQLSAGWREARFVTAAWSRRVAAEEENLRSALACALADHDGPAARELLNGLWPFWTMVGRAESAEWFEQALELPGEDDLARAEVSMGLAILVTLWELSTPARAEALLESALRLAIESGDPGALSWARHFRGEMLFFHGDRVGARREFEAGHRLAPHVGRAAAFHHALGWVALAEGDRAEACAEFERAIAIGAQGDLHAVHAQASLAAVTASPGDDRAVTLAAEALAAARRFQLPGVLVMALVRAAQTHLLCGCDDEAAGVLGELLGVIDGLGTRGFQPDALEAAALFAHRRGDHLRVVKCLGAAHAVRNDRAQNTGFALLGPQLAIARAAAEAALGKDAVVRVMAATEAGPSTRIITDTREWLEGCGRPGPAGLRSFGR